MSVCNLLFFLPERKPQVKVNQLKQTLAWETSINFNYLYSGTQPLPRGASMGVRLIPDFGVLAAFNSMQNLAIVKIETMF